IAERSLGIDFLDPGAASVAILPEKDVAYYIKSEEQHGFLQKDIYRAIRDSVGNWVEIGRLDAPVNSFYNEDFLYWCEEEQALYFSSDRKMGTVGGFDVFRSETDKNGNLHEPVNIGLPVNTPTDDIYYRKSDTLAFYASFNGNNKFDLYSVTYQEEAPAEPPPKPWYEKYTDLPGVQRIDKWVSCEHFYFGTSQSMPDTSSKSYKILYKALIENPGLKVKLTGHADWTGDSLLNRKISYDRASNLFFALCMDGVNSEQLKLDFQGSSRLRTKNQFKNKKLYSLAKAANRCVTVEVIDHGGTYLYVAENPDFEVVLQDDSDNRFAIMLNVSENKGDDFNQPLSDTLQCSVINQLQIMHTRGCSKLPEVANLKKKYGSAFPGTYIFSFCQ
ncbi:MAG TPA: hypothetical protein VJ951_10545, partial [Bacteroidales bacterium]|nr:hypothetical protein [Bacteroidales bacterium]